MPRQRAATGIDRGNGSNRSLAAALLFPASFANTIDLKCVPRGFVVVFAPNLLLQLVHFRRKEFHRTPALGTYHVMMAAPVVLMLVTGNPVVKRDNACQPAFGQQLESAIDSGKPDFRIFSFHQPVQFVGRKMFPRLQKRAQNRIALSGMLEPNSLEMLMQNRLRLPHHLPRDAGLIVNPLLQGSRH